MKLPSVYLLLDSTPIGTERGWNIMTGFITNNILMVINKIGGGYGFQNI